MELNNTKIFVENVPLINDKTSLEVKPCNKNRFKMITSKIFSQENIFLTAFNISNSTIGSGILFLPYVISKVGLILGLFFICVAGILGYITVFFLHKSFSKICVTNKNVTAYEDIGKILYGKWASFTIQLCIFFLNFGSTTSFSIVVSHLLSGWIEDLVVRNVVLFFVLLPFILATMFKKIASLRFLSFFAMVSIYIFILLIIICYFLGITNHQKFGEVKYVPDFSISGTWLNIFSYLSIVSFSYSCHSTFFCIVAEFKQENRYKITLSILIAVMFDYFVYGFVGSYGYLSFVENTQSDIILSYHGDGWINDVLRVTLAISILSTYPMSCFPARVALTNFLRDIFEIIRRKPFEGKSLKVLNTILLIATTLFIGLVSYLIAVVSVFFS